MSDPATSHAQVSSAEGQGTQEAQAQYAVSQALASLKANEAQSIDALPSQPPSEHHNTDAPVGAIAPDSVGHPLAGPQLPQPTVNLPYPGFTLGYGPRGQPSVLYPIPGKPPFPMPGMPAGYAPFQAYPFSIPLAQFNPTQSVNNPGSTPDSEQAKPKEGHAEDEGGEDDGIPPTEDEQQQLNLAIQAAEASGVSRRDMKYMCQTCSRVFTRLYNLKSHIRSHQGLRPYKCKQCPASFTRNHDLNRHERTHVDEKPFTCPVCLKKFSRKDALRRHQRQDPDGNRGICVPLPNIVNTVHSSAS